MPMPPQKFREALFQILFMSDFAPDFEEVAPFMMAELKTTRKEILAAIVQVKKILEHLPQIDAKITEESREYSFDRITRVERTILRLILFELLFGSEMSQSLAIGEATRLCRKFATNEGAQFINAVIDGVSKRASAQ